MAYYNRIQHPVYFNDFDEGSVAWLRELMKHGHLPPGEVDSRSILEVEADDLREFRQCHFFAGIGGWPYALRLAGVPLDWSLWTGSPPCQPFSSAGRQEGRDDERHLAPKFASLVGAGRPGLLFGEQVASAEVFGKAAKRPRNGVTEPPQWAWLDDLCDRLEAARYAVGASDFPSAGVGAPHIRQRTFFGAIRLADGGGMGRCEDHRPRSSAGTKGLSGGEIPERERLRTEFGTSCDLLGGLAHSLGAGLEGYGGDGDNRNEPEWIGTDAAGSTSSAGADGGLADDESQRRTDGSTQQRSGRSFFDEATEIERVGNRRSLGGLADCAGVGWIGRRTGQARDEPGEIERSDGLCDAGSEPATGPTNGFWRDADWLFCRDGKWRPVEPGAFPLAHGVPGRVGLLRGYGNAINPEAAAIFIRAFLEAAGIALPAAAMDTSGLIVTS